MARFAQGDVVRLKSDNSIEGAVIKVFEGSGEIRYQVFTGTMGIQAYYESQLRYVRYAMDSRLRRAANLDLNLRRRLHAASPQARIARYTDRYATCTAVMDKLLSQNVSSKEGALKAMAAKLDGLSPFAVLSRGYSIAEKDGEIISSKTQLKPGDDFTLRLSDGTVKATAAGE